MAGTELTDGRGADGGMVTDDPELLSLMLADAQRETALWTPTAYWRGYAARIKHEIDRVGLARLRTNQILLKGFAVGGVPRPELPRDPWKRRIWTTLE